MSLNNDSTSPWIPAKRELENIGYSSIMQFGKHKGKKLYEIPASYLLYLYDNKKAGRYTGYIKDNLKSLRRIAFEKSGAKNKK